MTALVAPAKLTWWLEVVGRGAEGRHELRAEMVSLDFADRLEVDEGGDGLRVLGPYSEVPLDDANLVRRALALVQRSAAVTLDKVVPPGGGLGGGSSDAAAILRWAGGVSADAALTLGSDVPYCQLGGRALVEGDGRHLTPLDFEARDVTLVLTGLHVETAAVYRAYDEMVSSGERPGGRNHLEAAARRVEPRLARVMDWLVGTLGQRVHLAGSGSSLFVEGRLAEAVESWEVPGPEGPVRFRQTRTVPRGA